MAFQIVSGGQTGVDRAALDAAIAAGVAHGGWCPATRWAEDGPLPQRYALRETPSSDPAQRTAWNVRDSDGTLILTLGANLQGGTLLTLQTAEHLGRPSLWLHEASLVPQQMARDWFHQHGIQVLNIAGSRESEEPGVYLWAREIVEAVLNGVDKCS